MNHLRRWSLLLCVLAGCSTRPVLDLCDTIQPGKLGPTKVQPYGGVGIPQGAIVPVAQPIPGVVIPVVPPPAPLPGNRPPGAIELQPPAFPPIPPPPPNR